MTLTVMGEEKYSCGPLPLDKPCHVSSPFAPHSAGSGEGRKAVLEIQGLWHPCAVSRVAGDAVVPNDLVLGSQQQHG